MTIIYILILLLSFFINIVTIFISYWYVREAVEEIIELSSRLYNAKFMLEDFLSHINSIYELEMFYGDTTLKSLIEHTRRIKDYFSDYNSILEEEEIKEDLEVDEQ